MRVLYGIQGTGNGHLTRSLLVIKSLSALGATVDVLVSGRPADAIPHIDGARDVQHRHGVSFVARDGRMRPLATLVQVSLRQFVRDVRALELDGYDRLVTDYEPVLAWAGRSTGRPVIGVGHQYAFGRGIPSAMGDPVSHGILRGYAPVVERLGLHWAPYAPHILPPIVDVAALQRRPSTGTVVVYLPWKTRTRS
ncbi:MAG: glycosyltransferase family protein, partial [Pseudomonadota bacterium]